MMVINDSSIIEGVLCAFVPDHTDAVSILIGELQHQHLFVGVPLIPERSITRTPDQISQSRGSSAGEDLQMFPAACLCESLRSFELYRGEHVFRLYSLERLSLCCGADL